MEEIEIQQLEKKIAKKIEFLDDLDKIVREMEKLFCKLIDKIE